MAKYEELSEYLAMIMGGKVATKYGNGRLLYVDKSKAGVRLDDGVLYRMKILPMVEIEIEASGEMVMFEHEELEIL